MFVFYLITFAFFVVALLDVILRRDDQIKHLPKITWVFIVILLPLIGAILWFAIGREYESSPRPRRPHRPAHDTARSAAPYVSSTEAQLAALEHEIELAERDKRIRELEEQMRRSSEGETA
ncbi:PLD nuclease N-terminal domain-containing protein [Leifsonia shinshuensis]|uniref:PLD nuclease N-terminal domain-containing protein n=1 Tax=Leifsonia shinshuensis TaxID=150026 RepID=UPI001F512925|nr:PLD nuclease N-terminal domain-containing protein [Leifsonia shinshuensis]MCI0158367.1 PLD nuclease N-terminal domain-containing protein [Leifsonia shinshuensis]